MTCDNVILQRELSERMFDPRFGSVSANSIAADCLFGLGRLKLESIAYAFAKGGNLIFWSLRMPPRSIPAWIRTTGELDKILKPRNTFYL
jgi:hypothetical protein